MSTTVKVFRIIFIPLLLISLIAIPIQGQEKKAATTYVDHDGDGFDDNLTDSDGNGIPDADPAAELAPEPITSALNSPASEIGLDGVPMATVESGSSNSTRFKDRRFAARSLASNRCSLDSDAGFGPGNGIGFGAVVSGLVCEGGVCHPR